MRVEEKAVRVRGSHEYFCVCVRERECERV